MFYILNFSDHSFMSCHTSEKVTEQVDKLLSSGVHEDEIEIINCWIDGVRLTVNDFRKTLTEG